MQASAETESCCKPPEVLLKGLVGPAFELQRRRHNLSDGVEGLILADGWSGFHSYKSGLDLARNAWSLACRVRMADIQPGGFSANAQPVDQIHHLFRARLDLVDSADASCTANLRAREDYHELAVRPNGQLSRTKARNNTLPERTLHAWISMQLALICTYFKCFLWVTSS